MSFVFLQVYKNTRINKSRLFCIIKLFEFLLRPTNMIQLKILLWITMLINYWSLSNAIVLADFRRQALNEHNALRRLHCTGAIALNSSLNSRAQNYANYLARNKLFQHSGASGLGENLWSSWSSAPITRVNGKISFDSLVHADERNIFNRFNTNCILV